MAIGEFEVEAYKKGGIRYVDAIDPDLLRPIAAPTTGTEFLISQQSNLSYKRLSRVIAVPEDGAELSFLITRDTEPYWDFFFVEAHSVGADDWTTLPDIQGFATQEPGFGCPFSHQIHPFLAHYQTAPMNDGEPCAPVGETGEWWAATGASQGVEEWVVDLSAWAGSEVEVVFAYASDDIVQNGGVFIDDVLLSTGEGSTSFEDDGDTLDSWTLAGPPEGSPGNENDWMVGDTSDLPPSRGEVARASLARQPEIIAFLEGIAGRYPFNAAGGIVDDVGLAFALENQTRPIYSDLFFSDSISGDSVIVHELAHQWFGDRLTVETWQHIWLNEGFATYAEWLWSEHEGLASAQEIFEGWFGIEPENPFWSVVIGDPGPDFLFDGAVYGRGAMTLHQLRQKIGDEDFFELLQRWAPSEVGRSVTTDEFIALAEEVSGMELDELFDTWLFAPEKPVLD